jgi:hypothetical protein
MRTGHWSQPVKHGEGEDDDDDDDDDEEEEEAESSHYSCIHISGTQPPYVNRRPIGCSFFASRFLT